MSAKLNLRFGSMAAAKTANLLAAAWQYREGGHQVELYTAAIDDRYGVGRIKSRMGIEAPAKLFDVHTDFEAELSQIKVACVFIDECQFISETQALSIHKFVHKTNTPVVAYGLRTDFQGRPFPGSSWLLALADDVSELRAICACGRKASMNARFDEAGNRERSGESILIGGNSRYRSVCPKCFYEA